MAFSAINHKGKIILGSKNVIYSYDASKKELAELISFNEINDYNVSDIIIVGNDSLVCSDRWYGMKLVDLKKKKSASNPQLSSSASFLRLNVLSSLN